jgi:hypothetical protein
MSVRLASALTGLLAFACLLCLAAQQAHGAYDPVGSGQTKISLDPGFLALLKENKVKLVAKGGAKLEGSSLSLPLAGGKFDPLAGTGTLEQEGSLVFAGAKGSIPLRSLALKTTQRHAPFSGKLGGSQLKLFSAKSLASTRLGFGEKVKATKLALSAKAAGRLAKKLHLPGVFAAGEPFGSSSTTAQPATVTIVAAEKATLTLDPGLVAKLSSLFVAVNPIFPAEHQGPTFTLPIAAGKLAPELSSGDLGLAGSLELLQLGGGQVFWREVGLDLGARSMSAEAEVDPSPPYPGKLGLVPIAALAYPPTAVSADPGARTIALGGGSLALGAAIAAAFNQAFANGAAAFAAGEPLGTISFTADAQ